MSEYTYTKQYAILFTAATNIDETFLTLNEAKNHYKYLYSGAMAIIEFERCDQYFHVRRNFKVVDEKDADEILRYLTSASPPVF